eukprot:scaffold273_cov242-Pinguiococcus_pyrenoidosus.AAC.6
MHIPASRKRWRVIGLRLVRHLGEDQSTPVGSFYVEANADALAPVLGIVELVVLQISIMRENGLSKTPSHPEERIQPREAEGEKEKESNSLPATALSSITRVFPESLDGLSKLARHVQIPLDHVGVHSRGEKLLADEVQACAGQPEAGDVHEAPEGSRHFLGEGIVLDIIVVVVRILLGTIFILVLLWILGALIRRAQPSRPCSPGAPCQSEGGRFLPWSQRVPLGSEAADAAAIQR